MYLYNNPFSVIKLEEVCTVISFFCNITVFFFSSHQLCKDSTNHFLLGLCHSYLLKIYIYINKELCCPLVELAPNAIFSIGKIFKWAYFAGKYLSFSLLLKLLMESNMQNVLSVTLDTVRHWQPYVILNVRSSSAGLVQFTHLSRLSWLNWDMVFPSTDGLFLT